jgi:uncharacterized C2H2 Zn-finger protein
MDVAIGMDVEAKLIKCPKCKCFFLSTEDLESHYNAWHVPGGIYYGVKNVEKKTNDESA